MTNLAEARLSREAEICYTCLAAITDYDCWHPNHGSVTLEAIMSVCKKNIENSKKIIKNFILEVESDKKCSCQNALSQAIVTNPNYISPETKNKLGIMIDKYIK